MKRLSILRPEPGAAATLALAKHLGIDAVCVPLFRIDPIPWHAPETGGFDALLLTSASAVRFGGQELSKLRGLKVHAVGSATAEAATESGFVVASEGSAGVQCLIDSIEPRQTLLHLCGEVRMDFIATGHEVRSIAVYRAVELPRPDNLARNGVCAVHSPRAARRLSQLIGGARGRIAIAAISGATAEAAGPGWLEVAIAHEPNDRSLLALAKELCDKPCQR